MTTSIVRFKKGGQVELSSDRLVVGGHTGIRYDNKIITFARTDPSDPIASSNEKNKIFILYSGKNIPYTGLIERFLRDDLRNESISAPTFYDMQQFIRYYDSNMQMIIFYQKIKHCVYITSDYLEDVTHDFAIGSGGDVAMGLLRCLKDIPTEDIYKTVASLDIFTSKEYDSILLPI